MWQCIPDRAQAFWVDLFEWWNHADHLRGLIDDAHVSSQTDREDYCIIVQLH